MVLKESSAYDPSSPNHPPPSLGAGGRPIDQSKLPPSNQVQASILRDIAEARSNYTLDVKEDQLQLSYILHNNQTAYSLPWSALPLSAGQRWFLYGGKSRAASTGIMAIDTVRGAHNMLGRPLSQQEAEGFAFHASRRMTYSYLGVILAFNAGVGLAYAGRKKMKFPFRKPQPAERYNNFPNRYLPVIKGPYARAMWHITRANVYTALTFLLLAPFVRSMGDTAMIVGLYRDPRTKDAALQIRDRGGIDRIGSNRPRSGEHPAAHQPHQPQSQDQYSDAGPDGYYADTESDGANDQSGAHTYSSTYSSGDSSYTDGTTDTSVMSDAAMQSHESRQSSPSSTNNAAPTRGARFPQQQRRPEQRPESDYFWDDASPTAGAGTPYPASGSSYPSSRGSQGGTAWENIRRTTQDEPPSKRGITPTGRSSSPAQTYPNQQPITGPAKSESFSFDRGEEERALAKEMAQRDFDEMLERERRGNVSESGSGGGLGRASGRWFGADKNNSDSQTSGEGRSGSGDAGSVWAQRRRGG